MTESFKLTHSPYEQDWKFQEVALYLSCYYFPLAIELKLKEPLEEGRQVRCYAANYKEDCFQKNSFHFSHLSYALT